MLTYLTLRAIARASRTYRLAYVWDCTSPSEPNWHMWYHVRINGRDYALWNGASPCRENRWIITIDGRSRFFCVSSIFSPTLSAWEALTGIRYLGRYTEGTPIYGCRVPVEIMPIPSEFPSNYAPGQILVTDEEPGRLASECDFYHVAVKHITVDRAESLIGKKVGIAAKVPDRPCFTDILIMEVTRALGLDRVRLEALLPGYGFGENRVQPLHLVRECFLKELYQYSA